MSIWTWFGKIFKSVKNDGSKVAIAITEEIKKFVLNPVAGFLATLVDKIFDTHLAEDALTLVKNNINKVLAVELAIQGLPDNPTEDEISAFENEVVKAVTNLDTSGKSKLWTTVAAQVYGIIQTDINNNTPLSFAELVKDVEEAYQDYLKDLADSESQAAADDDPNDGETPPVTGGGPGDIPPTQGPGGH